MKKYILKYIFGLFLFLTTNNIEGLAQQGFGTSNPNNDAVIDLFSINKGLLLPRLLLSSTGSPSPLSVHVSGMTVYNTAISGDVTPGFYYNDGLKWLRADTKPIGNWNLENTNTLATAVNQDIYQMGKVGVGTKNPTNPLHVVSGIDPVKILGLKEVKNVLGSNVVFVNPNDGIWKTSTVNLPLGYVKKSILSQVFNKNTFNNGPPTEEVITFSSGDELVVDNGFVTLNNNEFTITATGVYDVYAITNLLTDASGTNFTSSGQSFMSVILKLQKATGAGPWTDIVSTISLSDVSGAHKDITATLMPIITVVSLLQNDKLRLVIKRNAGAYTTVSGNTAGTDNTGIRTSSSGNGVTNSKIFKIIKLK